MTAARGPMVTTSGRPPTASGPMDAWGGRPSPEVEAGTRLSRTLRVYEHLYRLELRIWRGEVFNSFVGPALFLIAMGIGLGGYVDRNGTAATGGVPYLVFLAPGLLAATVMTTAAGDGTFPVMGGMVWTKRFHAMFATPIGPEEIALAHLAFSATRTIVVAAIYIVVMALFGAVRSPLVVLAIPAAVLTGLAFTAPISAFAATQRTMESFTYIFRFLITPLFLFSGAFFPIDRLPSFLQPVAWLTPTFHGVALARGLALGTAAADLPATVTHVAVLVAFIVAGTAACLVTFRRRLAS